MASRTTNTQSEALQGLLTDIARIKTMPDADVPWLIQLETMILSKLREPIEQMMGQVPPLDQLPTPSLPAPPLPAPSPAGPYGGNPGGGMGQGVPGLRQVPNLPPPDEIRRMMQR